MAQPGKGTLGSPGSLFALMKKNYPFMCDVCSVVTGAIFLLSRSKPKIDLTIKDELSAQLARKRL
jgi:hypothetical protein